MKVFHRLFVSAFFVFFAFAAFAKNIPVYPDAKLVVEPGPADEQACCDFLAKDAYGKVLSFYESALKTKALDAQGLAAAYPALKPHVEAMVKQMPPQMKIRFFVLNEVAIQGQKGAELFEVVSTPQGVTFNISEDRLLPKDGRFAVEFGEKTSGALKAPKPSGTARLLAALPSAAPQGFQRGEVLQDDETGQPMASVPFSKLVRRGSGGEDGGEDQYVEIQVTINDAASDGDYAEYARDMIKPQRPEEKAVKVRGKYDGKESADRNEYGCVESQKVFLVDGRYLVEVRGQGVCDVALLDQLIESMDLARLSGGK